MPKKQVKTRLSSLHHDFALQGTYLIKLLLIAVSLIAADRNVPYCRGAETTWNLSIGAANLTEKVMGVVGTKDGGYAVFGTTKFNGSIYVPDLFYLFKLDADGKLLWTQRLFTKENVGFKSVTFYETGDGGFIISGEKVIHPADANSRYYLATIMKVDSAGKEIWQYNSGQPMLQSNVNNLKKTKNGGIVATIYHQELLDDPDTGRPSYYYTGGKVLHIDANGEIIFEKVFDQKDGFTRSLINETADGNFLISWARGNDIVFLLLDKSGDEMLQNITVEPDMGYNFNWLYETKDKNFLLVGDENDDLNLLLVDAEGHKIWRKAVGDPTEKETLLRPDHFIAVSDGGYMAALMTYKENGFLNGLKLIRLDADGNEIWSIKKPILNPTDYASSPRDIIETADAGFILTTNIGTTFPSIILLKLDRDGNEIWRRQYGGDKVDLNEYLHQTADGGFFLAGHTTSHMNRETLQNRIVQAPNNIWLIKTDAQGNAPETPDFLTIRDLFQNSSF